MAHRRLPAAARKLAGAMEANRADEPTVIGAGVRALAREIEHDVEPGTLYYRAPIQYAVEQMAPRVAQAKGVAEELHDDLRAYLLAGVLEYVLTVVAEFDAEHFEAWRAAIAQQEQANVRRADGAD